MHGLTPDLNSAVAGVLGAAVSLAGLLLVFIGFLFSQVNSGMSDVLQGRYKRAARFGLIPFLASLALSIAATTYWLSPSAGLAHFVIVASMALVIAVGIYGVLAAYLL